MTRIASRVVTRRVVVAIVLGLLLALLPGGTRWRAVAVPRTQSAAIDGLPAPARGAAAVPVAGLPSARVRAPIVFSLVGFEVPRGTEGLSYRTSVDGEAWSTWAPVEGLDDTEGPDASSPEADGDARVASAPEWVGRARFVQVATVGVAPADVGVHIVDSRGLADGPVDVRWIPDGGARAATGPDIVTRAEWGAADYKGEPSYADDAHMLIVHHTVTGNDYSEAEAPDVVRAIQRYHQDSNGWNDIGYNLLVDRYGNIYEGRAGGLRRAVIGAHARGWNTGSVGIAMLGTFTDTNPTNPALGALIDAAAWKAGVHGIDAEATTTQVGDGSRKPTVAGHRDVGSTACPGGEMYNELNWLRSAIADETYPFTDVDLDSVHADAIRRLYEAGIVHGCTSHRYCPLRDVTRAQAAALVVRTLGFAPVEGSYFEDVPPDMTHAGAINALAERGSVSGYPDGTFRPHESVSRGEMASILANSLDLEPSSGTQFTDVSEESAHYGSIYALYDQGVVEGCRVDRYCPWRGIHRDEVATLLDRTRSG